MLDFTKKSVILFPMSEKNTMSKVYGARWSPHALAEIAKKKHPFIPCKETEKKDLTFKPKSETINVL